MVSTYVQSPWSLSSILLSTIFRPHIPLTYSPNYTTNISHHPQQYPHSAYTCSPSPLSSRWPWLCWLFDEQYLFSSVPKIHNRPFPHLFSFVICALSLFSLLFSFFSSFRLARGSPLACRLPRYSQGFLLIKGIWGGSRTVREGFGGKVGFFGSFVLTGRP